MMVFGKDDVVHESGGAFSSSGEAQIVCGSTGERLRPVRILHSINGNHASFPVASGMHIIRASWDASRVFEKYQVEVFRLDTREDSFFPEKILEENLKRAWATKRKRLEYLAPAIRACLQKSMSFLCNNPFYIVDGQEGNDGRI